MFFRTRRHGQRRASLDADGLEFIKWRTPAGVNYKRYLSWLKARRALRRIPRLIENLHRQGTLLWTVIRSPATRQLFARQPLLPFKHLSDDYLAASGLTLAGRSQAFNHHYRFLDANYRLDFQKTVFGPGVTLYKLKKDLSRYQVDLIASGPCYEEGELSLSFKCDGTEIYCLSFTFIPGRIVGRDDPTVILVSRLQGTRGLYPLIRKAMTSLDQISLPIFLMTLLEGVAVGSGVHHLAGVSASNLSPLWQGKTGSLKKAYDCFFESLGARQGKAGFYHIALPLTEKPLSLVDSCNRSRSRTQRELKAEARFKACWCLTKNGMASVPAAS